MTKTLHDLKPNAHVRDIHTFASWEMIEIGKVFTVLSCKQTKQYKSGKRVYQVIAEVSP